MKAKDFYQGGYFTTLLLLVTFLTVIGEQLITYGVVASVVILTAFSIITKIVIANCNKDYEAVDWKSVGSYSLAAMISAAITLGLYFIAI